ncbi:hypothetical protein ABEB36_000981 [Hypothenemus hampei]|uniref:Ionotropic glutamate receptor C-terminal domain-containing protein n=1 Tax=Hypothenemus hampei TaxID=57062 RepID=A0ABD1FD23_HYPHA
MLFLLPFLTVETHFSDFLRDFLDFIPSRANKICIYLCQNNDLAIWSLNGTDGQNFLSKSLARDKLNLNGSPMRVSFYYSYKESLNHLTDFRYIAEFLNASYYTTFTSNFGLTFNETTNFYEEGSMLGDVQRGKADIAGITGWIEKTRINFFRFFGPTTPDTIRFLFRAPPISLLQNVYLMPFDVLAWYCVAVIVFVGILLLFFILIQERYLNQLGYDATIVDVIMTFLSALLQKSWDLDFKSFAGRLSLAVTYLSFLVLFNAYSASIIVFLQGTSETITNFEELFDAKFDIGVHDVNYNRYYFLNPNDRTDEEWRLRVFKEKISQKSSYDEFFLTVDKGIEKMQNELFGFQSQISAAHYVINKKFTQAQKCTVRYVKTIYLVDNAVYMAIRKNSPYLEHYKIGMRRIFEHGLQRRIFQKLFNMKLPCEGNISYFSGIGVVETRFIFEVFLLGVIMSVQILFLEILVEKWWKVKRRTSVKRFL